ncbi:MAG TPA: SDR family oxidoreductase [Desulfobacterales bacterium]|nr:SDR family oxidoreductase [Desulfobacterales bacterium]
MSSVFESALVTGGAGFIGSHLVEALVAEGCRVTVLDDLSSGRESNLVPVAGRITFMRGSICDREFVMQAAAGCEVVFHLAAVVSVPKTVDDPLGSAAVNETGSLNVLEAARGAQARRVVFASSSAVYGDDPTLPKREQMPPKPLTPYAVQKLVVEYYLSVYQSLYGLETVGLRFFNVFGPRQDPSSPYSGVISIFMNKALSGAPPVIYGDGRQSRDFVFVGDVVQALIAAAKSASAPGKVFNVGTGKSLTISGLWGMIAALSGSVAQPVHQPARPGDIPHSLSAIDSAAADLGFVPRVSLESGLGVTLDWYRGSTPEMKTSAED